MYAQAIRRLVFSLLVIYGVWRAWDTQVYTDFDVYYRMGERLLAFLKNKNGVNFYPSLGETSPFRYAPVFGWVFIPFAFLPLHWARSLWVLGQWIFYGLSLKRVEQRLKLSVGETLILLLGTLRFALDNSNIAQISALMAWLLIEAALSTKAIWRGIALSLACTIKTQPLFLLGIWLIKHEWKTVSWFFISAALLMVLSLTLGWQPFQAWVSLLKNAVGVLPPDIQGNQSLYGFWVRVLPGILGKVFFVLTFLLCLIFSLWIWWKSGGSQMVGWVLGLAFLPIFGILTWKNTYLFWILPLAYGLKTRKKTAIVASFIFLMTSHAFIGGAMNGYFMHIGFLPWVSMLFALILFQGVADKQLG